MIRALLLGASAYAGLASASAALASDYTSTSTSTKSSFVCSTAYGSGGLAPTPIPTTDVTRTTSSLFTSPAATIPRGYTRVTDKVVTITEHTSYVYSFIIPTVSSGVTTIYPFETTTIATATWPVTSCTNGVKPKTVTKYTGKYTPVPGQATSVPKSYPTQVSCSTSLTSYLHLFPTVTTEQLGTIHETYTTHIYDYTTTVTTTATYLVITVPSETVTISGTKYVEVGRAQPTWTACKSDDVVTKTLDARCAPTNLIKDYNGVGLTLGHYNDDISVVYVSDEPYTSDPSACCQLCLDNEGCGVSWFGPSEVCGLYYQGNKNGKPQCGNTLFTYSTWDKYSAGQGGIFANGCGSTEYEAK